MLLKCFLAKEIRFYRVVFLLFPLLGCLYWYLNTCVSLYPCGVVSGGIVILMELLMTPGSFLLCSVAWLLELSSMPCLRSDLLMALLFVACQTLFGLVVSRGVKRIGERLSQIRSSQRQS